MGFYKFHKGMRSAALTRSGIPKINMPMRMREEQKDRALHVSCEGWTGIGFGVTLFADVCTDVAALAIQKEGGEAALRLFDPYAPAEDVFAGMES